MTDDRHDDADDAALPEADRAALARWQPDGPPADFADRVLSAHAAPAPVRAPMRIRFAVGAVALAGAVALVVIATRPDPTRLAMTAAPRRAIDARETVAIGGRAVAVAEPGAELGYLVSGRAAHIDQFTGGVFYRVEPGGRFVVVTPVGTIEVTGTCFRVEIQPMNAKQMITSGVLGAVVATAAVVTVYEGKIRVVGGGAPVEVQAGQRATITPGAAVAVTDTPTTAMAKAGGPTLVIARTEPDPSVAALSREQLIERDRAQREQLAALAQRVQQLESGQAGGGKRGGLDGDDWLNPTKDELAQWAKECRINIDYPPVMSRRPMEVSTEIATALPLTPAEVAAANTAFAATRTDWTARVLTWYIEATGDATGADSLSAHAMGQELADKAAPGEPAALQRRIAEERAGLYPAPADLSKASAFERYFRALADLGNQAERQLATAIGADKAHAVRAHDGGWPSRMSMAGCDDGDGAPPQ